MLSVSLKSCHTFQFRQFRYDFCAVTRICLFSDIYNLPSISRKVSMLPKAAYLRVLFNINHYLQLFRTMQFQSRANNFFKTFRKPIVKIIYPELLVLQSLKATRAPTNFDRCFLFSEASCIAAKKLLLLHALASWIEKNVLKSLSTSEKTTLITSCIILYFVFILYRFVPDLQPLTKKVSE